MPEHESVEAIEDALSSPCTVCGGLGEFWSGGATSWCQWCAGTGLEKTAVNRHELALQFGLEKENK